MKTDFILGSAGHIDHGKTSLIRRLSGVDTDRLPEEKRRGITIELGFAELELGPFRLGIVDVPGHERFVRNMLAGATGMDIALLVIAADDSIKPQTREHLEILRLLNLEAGVIALTKCDLVEPDWLDLVEEEVRAFVASTFLADAPIVRTSAETGMGVDDLRARLQTAAETVAQSARMKRIEAPFRMAIDRTFTIAGHGTVVTGSVASGRLAVGDELSIQPGNIQVRVRGLHNHDRVVDEVHRGQRAAINLAGVRHDETVRGQELTSVGHLVPSKLFTVELNLLPSAPKPLKNRARVRLHMGTAEVLCSVRLLDRTSVEPGESAVAQLFLGEEAVATWFQPFVLRSESPVVTIGGGRVLDPTAEKIRRVDEISMKHVANLASTDQVDRASAALYFAGLRDWTPATLSRSAGVDDVDNVYHQLVDRGNVREIPLSPTRTQRVHRDVIEGLGERLAAALLTEHERQPLRSVLDLAPLLQGFAYAGSEPLLRSVLKEMQKDGRIRLTERGISLAGQGPKLSKNEQKVLLELGDIYRDADLAPPTVAECQKRVSKNRDSVPQLIALAVANGDLVEVGPDFYLHADVMKQIKQTLTDKLNEQQGMTLSEIREALGTTRKYAVPLCEHLDAIGFTIRDGDIRTLATSTAAKAT